MSTEMNMSIMKKVIEEGFNKGNYAIIPECYQPDFVEHQFGLHNTLEGVKQDIMGLRKAFPDFRLSIEDMVAVDDKVWLRMTARGTNSVGFMGPPNGKQFEIAVFDTCRFKEGKIVEHWDSPDRFAMMSQIGLIPKPPA